jgi:hypothetical protein
VTCRPYNVVTYAKVQVINAENALIYCDLISPQFVGSQYARCLTTFIQPKTYCNNIFENVYYMPVEKRSFQDMQASPRAMCYENRATFPARLRLVILAINSCQFLSTCSHNERNAGAILS